MDIFGYGLGLSIWLPFALGFLALYIVVGVFFLLNLRDLLRSVSPQSRVMEPDHVWLNFIPLFNLVWIFITITRVRDSVAAEFRSRGWAPQGDFGFGVGLAAAILSIISWGPLGLAALICWIIYWVRASELKNQLKHAQPSAAWAPSPPSAGEQGPIATGAQTAAPGACPFCGTAQSPEARFCRSCGRQVV